jgi:hypothetical protein
MLIKGCSRPQSLVQGGKGGRSGRHGIPGQGANGGNGGCGYKHSSGDSEIHKPGGMSGTDGRPGRSESCQLRNGDKGRAVNFQINVTGQPYTTAYPSRYDIIHKQVTMTSSEALLGRNIFQFSDLVDVSSITVENIGAMPTPIEPILCYIHPNSSFLVTKDKDCYIRSRLDPGACMTVCDPMTLQVKVPDVRSMGADMDPYRLHTTLHIGAQQLGPNGFACAFTDFDKEGSKMEFRFPVQNTNGIIGWSSLGMGERQKISFEVENVSNSDLGAKSTSGRQLYVQFYLNTDAQFDIASEHVHLSINGIQCNMLASSDAGTLWRGTAFPIDFLPASSRVVLEGWLKLAAQVRPYSQLGLQAEILLLDLPKRGETVSKCLSPVQRRQLIIASEPTYCSSASHEAILVTSSSTTQLQFTAWTEILTNRLGLSTGDFSVSMYGSLDPDFQLPHGATLREEFRKKLIVVLDEPFRPACDQSVTLNPSALLPFGGMAQSSGFDPSTQWLFVSSSEDSVHQLLTCQLTAPPHKVRTFNSVSEFFASKQASLVQERLQGAVKDLQIVEERIRVPAYGVHVEARRVATWLVTRDVLRHYTVSMLSEGAARWILVRQGYCRTANTVGVIKDLGSYHDSIRLLNSTAVLCAILQSCPLSTQISLYCAAVKSGKLDIIECIRNTFVRSFFQDLTIFWQGRLHAGGAQFSESFPTLSSLLASNELRSMVANAHQPHSGVDSGISDVIVNSLSALVAGLSGVAQSKVLRPLWVPWSRRYAIRSALLVILNRIRSSWKHALHRVEQQTALIKDVALLEEQASNLRIKMFRLSDRNVSNGKVLDGAQYRVLQELTEQRQLQSTMFFTAIQAGRSKAIAKTEVVEL